MFCRSATKAVKVSDTMENEINRQAIQVSKMTERDIMAVKNIEIEARLEPWSVDDYLKEIQMKDSFQMVVKERGKIVGFLIARLITTLNEISISTDYEELFDVELYNLAVQTSVQGQGIGQRLFDAFISEINTSKVKTVWLEVRRSNLDAIRFYKKNGFRPVGERKNFYKSPLENAYIMRLDLSHCERLD